MNEIAKVAIKVGIVVLKVAATYFIAKKFVEAGDERWGNKAPQQ